MKQKRIIKHPPQSFRPLLKPSLGWVKSLCIAVLLYAGMVPCAVAGQDSPTRTVLDLTGRQMIVPKNPQRVVALAPSVTEIIYALEAQSRLVGVTRFSNFPAEAQQLPKVGSYVHLDAERIAALQPDLCIAVKDGNPLTVVEQLQALGLPVFAVNPVDLETVMQSIEAIGNLLGAQPKAQAVVGDMRRRMARVEARIAKAPSRPKLFFQIGISPIVSVGNHTFIDTLIHMAGGSNVAAGATAYPRFSREQVIIKAPEVIVICSMAREAVFEEVKKEWLAWPSIPAVKTGAVYIAPPDLFDRPSPRLVDALEVLARWLHPQLFKAAP